MSNIGYYICEILAFIPAIVLHEVGHGAMAYRLGDPTAKNAGRLSLNPLKHIDPFGTVILPLVLMIMGGPIFGYAKPVPYNPRYFKDKRKGDLMVGMAGPAVNLIEALIGAALMWALYGLLYVDAINLAITTNTFLYYAFNYVWLFLYMLVLINLYLMFFNLLPIPPLDGSSIFACILPQKYLPTYYKIEQYAMPIFLIVVIVLPYIFNVNPVSAYLQFTAGNIFTLLTPIS